MKLGEPLPEGHASLQYEKFIELFGSKNYPEAICYRIKELRDFLDKAEKDLNASNVPPAEQGIALTLGVHLGNRPHAKDRITGMLVATRYFEADPKQGKVDKIINPVVGIKWDNPAPPQIIDCAYDAASLWP